MLDVCGWSISDWKWEIDHKLQEESSWILQDESSWIDVLFPRAGSVA